MGVVNHTLSLLKKYEEAALHFMPWSQRESVVRSAWVSGCDFNKAEKLGFSLRAVEKLKHTMLVEGADTIYEMVVFKELRGLSTDFVP